MGTSDNDPAKSSESADTPSPMDLINSTDFVSISVRTGDVTHKPLRLRQFKISRRSMDFFVLRLDESEAWLPAQWWQALNEQVQERSLKKWQYSDKVRGPLSEPNIHRLVTRLNSTPSYQLFLAGFQIASFIGLATRTLEEILRRFDLLSDISIGDARGSLYFLPDQLVSSSADNDLDDLVRNNKLCRAALANGGSDGHVRYYKPYATPIGFTDEVSSSAKSLWQRVRRSLKGVATIS